MAKRVPHEAKELARDMAFNPGGYREFGNSEGILPRTVDGQYYIEGVVEMGQADGNGQYRVVCLVNNRGKVIRKFWSATHYGTGGDAGKKPDFVEFQ